MYFFHFLHFLKITSQVKPDSKSNINLILVQIVFMLFESRLNFNLIYLVFITHIRRRLQLCRTGFFIMAVPGEVLTTKPGGGERDRTDDLLLAKQALSQLSYAPSLILFTS